MRKGDYVKRAVILTLVICIALSLISCKTVTDLQTSSQSSTVQNESQAVVESELPKDEVQSQEPESQHQKPVQAVTPQGINTDEKIKAVGALTGDEYSEIITELQSVLNEHKYNISLSVYSVDGSRGLEYNTQSGIFGACTVKAAYTLYACKQMESGNGSLDTQMTYEQKHYEPGTGDMQYSPFGTVFTMETALHKSMSISDNVGYLMSVDYFGRDGYNAWISELGCESLKIKPTVWSLKTQANDLVRIWCEMYNYFLTDTEYARFLKKSCTNTAGNYATAALSGVEYSHKQGHNSTGDWLSLSDAGIVWKGDTPYIIAILTDAPGPNSYSAGEFAKIINIVHNKLF